MRMPHVPRSFAASLAVIGAILLAAPIKMTAQATEPRKAGSEVLLGADYSYVRSNIYPGSNGLGLNGGGLQLEDRFLTHLASLADLNITHVANITPDHYALTQTTYTFGLRYLPLSPRARYQLFGEALVGAAYASGTLSPARTGYGQATALAVQVGGGLRIPLKKGSHGFGGLFLEPLRADYLYTAFRNGSENQQNDLRLSAGILVRIGR